MSDDIRKSQEIRTPEWLKLVIGLVKEKEDSAKKGRGNQDEIKS